MQPWSALSSVSGPLAWHFTGLSGVDDVPKLVLVIAVDGVELGGQPLDLGPQPAVRGVLLLELVRKIAVVVEDLGALGPRRLELRLQAFEGGREALEVEVEGDVVAVRFPEGRGERGLDLLWLHEDETLVIVEHDYLVVAVAVVAVLHGMFEVESYIISADVSRVDNFKIPRKNGQEKN